LYRVSSMCPEPRLRYGARYACHTSKLKIPPSGKLPESIITDFNEWISLGAADPRTEIRASPTARRVISAAGLATCRQWWAFQTVRELPASVIPHGDWARSKVDAFLVCTRHASSGTRRPAQAKGSAPPSCIGVEIGSPELIAGPLPDPSLTRHRRNQIGIPHSSQTVTAPMDS